jgi:replicative DNA helicase
MAGTNQARLLATIWRNEKLFLTAKNVGMRTSDFSLPACEMIFGILLDYRETYGKMPSMATLQDKVAEALKSSGDVSESTVKEVCNVLEIMSNDTVLDFEYARDKLLQFIRDSRITKVTSTTNDTEKISAVCAETNYLVQASTRKSQIRPFMSFKELLPQTEKELDIKIPTGIPFLDVVTGGGLNASLNEIGLGLAGTGVGKTNMMINFAISAAFAGHDTLFITLELTKEEIARRLFAMAAHIKMKEIKTPMEQWSDESKARMDYLAKSVINRRLAISDMSDRSYSVSDLVGEIETWKRDTKALCGTDETCRLVLVDWIDMLVPEAKDARMVQQPWQAIEKVGKDLKHMVNNQNVALWCVSQTNRSGAGTKKVRLDHISGAYSKNFFGSVVLGLAPVDEDEEDREISQNMSKTDLQKLKIECNRDLHLSILKNRDGEQKESDIYQGPTLRFWQSRSAWKTTERILSTGDMQKIFGDGLE